MATYRSLPTTAHAGFAEAADHNESRTNVEAYCRQHCTSAFRTWEDIYCPSLPSGRTATAYQPNKKNIFNPKPSSKRKRGTDLDDETDIDTDYDDYPRHKRPDHWALEVARKNLEASFTVYGGQNQKISTCGRDMKMMMITKTISHGNSGGNK